MTFGGKSSPPSLTYSRTILFVFFLEFLSSAKMVLGLGGMCSIAASYGEDDPLFCAVEATFEQQVFCWGRNESLEWPSTGPAMLGLSGGMGFMCGIAAGSQRPFCWRKNLTSINIVPEQFQNTSYDSIAAGDGHVCAARSQDALVDCWNGDDSLNVPRGVTLRSLVAGRRFVCGIETGDGGTARCWGDANLAATAPPGDVEFESLSAGGEHACGIVRKSREIRCWGDNRLGQTDAPRGIPFVVLSLGLNHGCAVRQDTHGVMCWGRGFNASAAPDRTEFLALASSRVVTCGVREDNLLVVCWGNGTEFAPPLQLSSPGVCTAAPCSAGEFSFNASSLGVVTAGLCSSSTQQVCAPCASDCSNGSFVSAPCGANDNRRCTDCSLCETSLCRGLCHLSPAPESSAVGVEERRHRAVSLAAVLGAAISGGVVVAVIGLLAWCCLQRRRGRWWRNSGSGRSGDGAYGHQNGGTGTGTSGGMQLQSVGSGGIPCVKPPEALRYRLSELRDATGNFKEVNELGRGSYGFVYKAVLGDGQLVAVKRANAAQRIHGSSRDFDAELEILCKLRHANIVNLVGYCGEMGERLLIYEFMPHGTLRDHLHGGLSPLGWGLRLRVAAQAARGLEFLHKEDVIHRDVKSANILLDAEWSARVAPPDAGYRDPEYSTAPRMTAADDVYGFGVVLLELLSGRKAYDCEFEPAGVAEWAGPRSVEPVARLAEIAEKCVRVRAEERPPMGQVAVWLEQIAQGSGSL
ncbi:serine/threonine-protein kinase-like protein CCR1 [Selaginella moellendorffii]|uniref:serine/threonine-protein kinase-like protein CCR1 n=1 Tax=Selaginella moellendorffii TaxID=88036 RepID=UPI000D1CEB0D|nr:serine/threonine-protein kinase-like protein CCR1 [Selaginella moellendorffii]|eukprot:XP_024520613.1 serine/threonine-protein kinase-like protein CCR1 [Selaginella moellendorffii]